MKKKYKLISADTIKNLIEFLDEIQFDAAKHKDDKESMHIINFCNWAINDLLNSYDAYVKSNSKKSREDYVDETFIDWNLPEMDDDEYEKLVDQFDNFLKNWEKKYYKKNSKKKSKQEKKSKLKSDEDFVPPFEDIAEYMSLDEIKEYLLEDEELTDEERFDLYYEEHRRVQEKKNSMSYEQLLKKSGLLPPPKNNLKD
tara:strand:- start:125 stop:721 length:597 start_codon:yes stop_codon:yes gene_type:complete